MVGDVGEYGPMVWHKGALFGSNVESGPVMFRNRAPGNYNYEVLVREGNGRPPRRGRAARVVRCGVKGAPGRGLR